MKKIFFIYMILLSNSILSQNYAYIEKDSISKVHFRLSDNRKLYNTELYFPCDKGNTGVNITMGNFEKERIYELSVVDSFQIKSSTALSVPIFYSNNIKSIDFYLYDMEGYKYSYSKKIDLNGYQTSIFSPLIKNNNKDDLSKNKLRIYIRVTPLYEGKPFQIILSELLLADFHKKELISPLPFFKKLFSHNNNNYVKELNPIFKNSKSNTDWLSLEYCQPRVYINTQKNSISNNHLLYDVIRMCVIDYPYFKEKTLSKDELLRELDAIWLNDSLNPECDLALKIQQFLRRSFHDGHFKIDLSCKKDNKVLGPLRISYIDGRYQISAVLDSILEKDIPLGSVLLNINNKAVAQITDSLIHENYANIYAKKRKLLTLNEITKDIISFEEGNKIPIEYGTPSGEVKKIDILYKKKYPLKPSFISTHCEYKSISPRISFYKINTFDELSIVRFQSIVDTIRNKNIILDLRSNGGGDLSSVDDLLSFFIHKQEASFIRLSNRDETVFDSLFYQSNNKHKMNESSQIIILIDSRTACSSEVFIEAMKNNSTNVTVIGNDNTSGTVANAYNIFLPTKNYSLTVNSPQIFKCSFGYTLEDVGIKPDITVEINSVFDLKPYEDKVLRTAIQFLNQKEAINYNNVNNNK